MDPKQGSSATSPSKKHKSSHHNSDGKSSSKKHSKSSKSDGGSRPTIKKEVTTPSKVQKKPMIQESDSEDDMTLGIQAPVAKSSTTPRDSASIYLAPVDATPPIGGRNVKVKSEKRPNQPNGIPVAKRKAIPSGSLEATPPIKRAGPKVKTEGSKVKKETTTPSLSNRKRKKSSESEEEEEEEEEESAYEEDPSSSGDDGDDDDDDDDDFKVPSAKRPKKTPPVSQKKKPAARQTPAAAKKKEKPTPKSASTKSTKPTTKSASGTKSKSTTSTPARTPASTPARKSKASAAKKPAASPTKAGGKKKKEEQEVRKWWEEEPLPDGIKWRNLEHKGPFFAPPYERLPAGVKLVYNGKPIELSEKAEEAAGFFAKMLEHDYTSKDVFCKNFFQDWRKEMSKDEASLIVDIKKCDFKEIHAYYQQKSEARKGMTKEEKLVIKEENEALLEEYGWCIIDEHKEKIGNFKIEPPGLFRGRGDHPKQGKIKRRIEAEDVIINIGKSGPVPAPPDGHDWRQVQSDNKVTWLASWTENIQGAIKYVMLSPNSKLKGEKDWAKYEVARRLKSHVDKIRAQYREDLRSKEMKIRQRAVAVYFIDKLALRAGNEKDSDESADTVGCCSLRVEHIKLHDELDGKEFVIEFDFLGKDSIRYYNRVPVDKQVFKNVRLFMKDKDGGDDLFDRLTTSLLNKHLSELMDGLTAKVFRTYNASRTLQEQLYELTVSTDNITSKMLSYNRANRAVAVLCNHQRAPPKTFDQQMTNLQVKIQAKEDTIIETKAEIKTLKKESRTTRDSKITSKLESKQKQLVRLDDQLSKLEVQATDKQENKEISLGTSKLNYLDPRISVGWSKKWDVPIEKIYNKTQRQKFAWAIDMAGEEFEF